MMKKRKIIENGKEIRFRIRNIKCKTKLGEDVYMFFVKLLVENAL